MGDRVIFNGRAMTVRDSFYNIERATSMVELVDADGVVTVTEYNPRRV